ncbi:aspartate aminotransferase family protein [Pectobacterium versatile]|uniref:Aspartate aminotransferase family protein n=2 Tax=Pectobacterium versatile TaxID=2488639 RepID=A0AAW3RRK6_9GAMM|nr:aspartate aminotransferase family protein [Pectobacterium versatile]MBA0159202.1 aspartate aminotransferase family protein [Pectobacterium versatile]MBA0172111.1 aspartate aminotransferase family protein [Pectobacterium versatile]MBN3238645.1 aspartate aminotransferase family protein [Pectobacterium versatile]MBQ4794017.1 aminotransferase class III-fold pyridoxal phosphate-dependent enzyme [Pectobacterium versatile]MCO4314111.1 aspartate aminotransferase family protein [Pectobacterium versa
MATRSTIMDTNSFRAEHADALNADIRTLTDKRNRVLGESYRLFYRKPVHLVRGEGQYLWDADGKKYLDVYNNVASIGHCHPAVIDAVHQQMTQLNTHTRYLHERILDYSEQLLATAPAAINRAMYMCTGSEANDLAIRVARAWSGGTGVIVSREAYHGTSDLTSGVSPALGSGQPLAATTRLVPPPDAYRVNAPDLGIWFANEIQKQIDDMAAHGIKFAAFLADSIFSSDGVHPNPRGFLRPVVDVVHRNGGIFIADEVQPGFARTGDSFWGFARHDVVPDIITTGKPMGNGIPVSGLLAKSEVLAAFSDQIPYFNTFGGNPVAMAAAQAVLKVIHDEQLQEHSRVVGAQLLAELTTLQDKYACVGNVRGAGLFIGFELVSDRENKTPDKALALNLTEALRDNGVLTSVAGPYGNVLKLRPPLAFQKQDIDWLVGALDDCLGALTRT